MLVRAVWTEQEKALCPEEQNLAPLRNFLLLVKTQFPQLSPSLQCSSPHHFRYHWHMEDFRYTFLFVGVKPGSSWTRGEGPAAPVTAATSGGTRAHVCCTPRRWDRAGGDARWGTHTSCDSCRYFASSPCSACSSLHVCHGGLAVTAIISRRHVHSSRVPGSAHTVHASCPPAQPPAPRPGPSSLQSFGCPRPPPRTLA